MRRPVRREAERHPWDAVLLSAGVLLLVLASGCMSPERRYRVLSLLFDGVPPPGAVATAEPVDPVPSPEARVRTRVAPPAPVFVRHEPECDECHDGDSRRLALPKDQLCWDCHDREDFEGRVVHGPVASGECTGCHSPHKSVFDYLLLSEGSTICARCHDEGTFPEIVIHRQDQGEECLDCHGPHAGDREYMLLSEARAP